MPKHIIIFTDGGARGNPGPAASGFVIYAGKEKILERGVYLGTTTNNQAEYGAILFSLIEAQKMGAQIIEMFMDSELAVRQLNRIYKVKDKTLAKLFIKIWNLSQSFQKISFTHIPREKNKAADAMVNQGIDEGLIGRQKPTQLLDPVTNPNN